MAELMEVTLFQENQGQQIVDRWNYVASGTPAAVTLSFAIISAMGFLPATTTLPDGTIGGELQSLQNSATRFASALARAVYIDDDFYDSPFLSGTLGAVGNEASASSPLNSYGFRSNRVKQSIGRGYKRFTGVEQSYMGNGGLFVSTALTQMQIVANLMGDTLTYTDDGNSLSFVPCIVQKEKYTVPTSGKEAYRYYASQATQLTHTAQGIVWELYDHMRSQVSRQYGRGI